MFTMLKVTKSVALRFHTVTPFKLQQFHNDSRRIVCTYSKKTYKVMPLRFEAGTLYNKISGRSRKTASRNVRFTLYVLPSYTVKVL